MLKGILRIYKTFLNENSIKLIKRKNYYSANIRLGKNCIEVSHENINYLKARINDFICIMASECKYFSKRTFLENFKTLKIKELTKDEIKELEKENRLKACSSCGSDDNLITLREMDYDHIFHEFIHLASKKKDDVFNEGFYYYIEGTGYVGRGINEGYTEILRERYFDIDLRETGYLYEYQMTKILELIIGAEKMEHIYFKGSLLILIRELSNYCSLEEAKQFIDDMDRMVFLIHENDEKSKQRRQHLLDKNYAFLKNCLSNKKEISKTR